SPAIPVEPANGPTIEDQAGAHPGREADVDHVADTLAAAELALAERAKVGVVVDLHGQSQPPLHLLGGTDPVPSGKDSFALHRAGGAVHRRGDTHADTEQAIGPDLRLVDRLSHELIGKVEALRSAHGPHPPRKSRGSPSPPSRRCRVTPSATSTIGCSSRATPRCCRT